MTDSFCGYPGERDEALVAYLYDDGQAGGRTLFENHLAACADCRHELAALRGVRAQLARWAPPEPAFSVIADGARPGRHSAAQWWREIPAWAQVAAALLFLGVSAGLANLDVRYDANGLSVRTGWMPPPAGARTASAVVPADGAAAPWRADLAALERQLKDEFRSVRPRRTRPRRHRRRRRSAPRRRRMPTSSAASTRSSTRARSASSASSRSASPS
jgi:anti-sigma factor RsiW